MTTPDNVLSLALANDELDRFLAGEPFYFVEAQTDNPEPQNVAQAFDELVVPQWQQDPSFAPRFVAALMKLLASYPDRNRAIYLAHRWVWYYRYCLSKKHAEPTGRYAGLFEVDLGGVAAQLKQLTQERKADLLADTRWAGASWNSDNGLWGPLLRTSIHLRDRLGGPDFVPDNP